jgi:hypothetical protein
MGLDKNTFSFSLIHQSFFDFLFNCSQNSFDSTIRNFYLIMFTKINVVGALLVVVQLFPSVTASKCIGNFTALRALQDARWNNTATPVTYVICPGTVFNFTGTFDSWDMNGNETYLCGADGSSTNKCVVTGGEFQFISAFFPFGRSSKDNILVSGFTFTKAELATGAVAAPGKFTMRDCIFRVRCS